MLFNLGLYYLPTLLFKKMIETLPLHGQLLKNSQFCHRLSSLMIIASSLSNWRKFESRQFSQLTTCPFCHHNLSTKQDYTKTLRVNNNTRIKSGKSVGSQHYIPLKRAHTRKKMTKVLLRRFHSFKQFKHLHTFPVLIFQNLTPILLNCKYRDCKLFLHCLIAPGILRIRTPDYKQGTLLILFGFHLPQKAVFNLLE